MNPPARDPQQNAKAKAKGKKKEKKGNLAQSIYAPVMSETQNNKSIYAPSTSGTENNNKTNAAPGLVSEPEPRRNGDTDIKLNWVINNAHQYLPLAARLEFKTDKMSEMIEGIGTETSTLTETAARIERETHIITGTTARLEHAIQTSRKEKSDELAKVQAKKERELANKEAELVRKEAELASKEAEVSRKEVGLAKKEAELANKEAKLARETNEAQAQAEAEAEELKSRAQNVIRSRTSQLAAKEALIDDYISRLSDIFKGATTISTMSTQIDAIYTAREEAKGVESMPNVVEGVNVSTKQLENLEVKLHAHIGTLKELVKERAPIPGEDGVVLKARLDVLAEGQAKVKESIHEALRVSGGIADKLDLRDIASKERRALQNNSLKIIVIAYIIHVHFILTCVLGEFGVSRNAWVIFELVGLVVLVFCYINKTAKCGYWLYQDTTKRWRVVALGFFLLIILVVPGVVQRGLRANGEWVDVIPNTAAEDHLLHIIGCNGTINQVEHMSPTSAQNLIGSEVRLFLTLNINADHSKDSTQIHLHPTSTELLTIKLENPTSPQNAIGSESTKDSTQIDLHPTLTEPLGFPVNIIVPLVVMGLVLYIVYKSQ